ncbi:MAG: hypothetical protein L3K01_00145 [Thermoplasmata archaeon]|nr:hypothetical protein [Thermoplasmata archaeon]MCI4332134.1 hypothetical protein [Thermoplasmata archaeon]
MAPSVPSAGVNWRYGIVALVVTAAVVGVVLWGTFGRPPPASSGTPCGLECGGGGYLAIGTPSAQGGPGNYSFVMSISPSSGLTWGQARFSIVSPMGKNLSPTSSWTIVIFSASVTPVAVFGFQTQTWEVGSKVLATAGQMLHLETGASDLTGEGDTLVVHLMPSATSPANGTVNVVLP